MQHEKITTQVADSVTEMSSQINGAIETAQEPATISDIAVQVTDVIVSSGLIEQYGPELGISGAVIVALIGIYWKYRKGESFTKEDVQTIISAFTEDKKPAEPEKTENKEAPEEVENLKKIEEESENKTEKA